MSWITSPTCEKLVFSSDISIFLQVQEWFAYILFAHCPQSVIICIINAAFITTVLCWDLPFNLLKRKGLKDDSNENGGSSHNYSLSSYSAGVTFITTLSLTILMSTMHIGVATWTIWIGSADRISYLVQEEVFMVMEALAWVISIFIVFRERSLLALEHSLVLRIWWALSFFVILLESLGGLFRLAAVGGLFYANLVEIADIFSFVKLTSSIYFLVVSVKGSNGISVCRFRSGLLDELEDPLLKNRNSDKKKKKLIQSSFTNANLLSKLSFSWLSPLLKKGTESVLEEDDIPKLGTLDEAETLYALFQSSYNIQHNQEGDGVSSRPFTVALFKCFWPKLLLIGSLQFVKICVMYVGPLLISSFISYTKGEYVSKYDGYILVLFLLLAKFVEVVASHHYNFQSYKLGNNLRSVVNMSVFRKSLRLSNLSRQAYGVGEITNYMVVDAQQLSDSLLQLHLVWSMPLQISIALVILYKALGISAFAGFATMIAIVLATMVSLRMQKKFQVGLMKTKDARMKCLNEALNYMKVLKLQAWERHMEDRIEELRQKEYVWVSKFAYSLAFSMFTLWNTPSLVSSITYLTCVLLKQDLTTSKVFTAASTFRIVQDPIRNFPQCILAISQAIVSLERLDRYMRSRELDQNNVIRSKDVSEFPVVVEGGSFIWEEEEEDKGEEKKPAINNINLKVKKSSIVAIVGSVGSGKSSLLSALLGEMVKLSGSVKISGSSAYVPQTPWIQNETIQENILFGSPMEIDRYKKTLEACALEPDMEALDHGDQTEIGERGINLSGGQKQRIQLARALYQNSDIYFLDDIFSAVDAHTGSHLFKECILGVLKGKTILLVTHQVEFLKGADLILVMHNGIIAQSGRYEDILRAGTDFGDLVKAHKDAMDSVNQTSETKMKKDIVETLVPLISVEELRRIPTTESNVGNTVIEGSARLIENEQRETGQVDWKVYYTYLTTAYGWIAIVVLLLNQTIWQALLICSDFWLANEVLEESGDPFNSMQFICVYLILTVISWFGVLVRTMFMATIGLNTTQIYLKKMLHSIFRAPMSYFDTTPSGRILSRFSSDQANLDLMLPFFFSGSLGIYFSAIGVLVVICISTWPILFIVIPLSWAYIKYQTYYINSSREMTRLDGVTKAPLIYHFAETVAGISTVRCFGKLEDFIKINVERVNNNLKMDFHNNSSNEWLGFRLEGIGSIVLCLVALLFVVLPANTIQSDLVGLALSYALSLNASLYWSVWITCTVENKMVSVERIRQCIDMPSEALLKNENCLPSPNWPDKGKIELKRLKLRYRPGTPLVLKGLSLTIEGGQKVGVVGRTGSGKSTLLQAIFRLIEASSGQILIDNVDIETLGLHDLRQRLGIIPQEPALFTGTIRSNIDPLGLHKDTEIWECLRKCQMIDVIKEKPEKLDTLVAEDGENWSVGQRQLFCFTRVLLKHSRLLFLDEATASIDTQTDGKMQKIILEEFEGCTVISIAHRITTVMDYDNVLVMDAGRVKEYGSPRILLENPSTLFSSLVREYANRSAK